MVEDIEEIKPQLHIHTLAQVRVLGQRKIPVVIARSHEMISRFATKVVTGRNQRAIRASLGCRIPIARRRKGGQIQDAAWRSGSSREWIGDDVRPFHEFVGAIEALEGIHLEWLSILHRDRAVH